MAGRLARRGPDDEQFFDDGTLALGFRRLSIVDVGGGRQPFWNEQGDILGVVNGEIYNHLDLRARLRDRHRFRSRSDSEVLIHLYEDLGLDLLKDVNGMFGLAIWDRQNRRLVLARDRLGIKPLYYTIAGDTVLFASELKALLAHPQCPRGLDWAAIQPDATLRRPVTPSYVNGIHHLPAGHMIVFEAGSSESPFAYWSLDDHFAAAGEPSSGAASDYVEQYAELFDDAVSRQLMSDVPVGIFLSGGVDSALITAVAARNQAGMHCFTIAEETTVTTGDLGQARRVAGQLGFPLHAVRFDRRSLLDELQFSLGTLEYMVWCMDSPRFQFEWFFKHELHRYARTVQPGLKVMLIGQGADEFAGGYSCTYTNPRNNWEEFLQDAERPSWRAFRQRKTSETGEESQLAHSDFQNSMTMNLCSLQFYNLWHEDRTSASNGMESRVPFLDHRLVEMLAGVPPALHEPLFWNKQIVREQLRRLLPDYPPDWPKVPFIDVPGRSSIEQLYAGVLERVYAQFCEKYVDCPASTLPAAQVRQLHVRAMSGSSESHLLTRQLLNIMCVAIFEQMCLQGPGFQQPSLEAASPLREI